MRKCILNNELKLIIEDDVLRKMYKYAPEDYKYENGGILLGKFLEKDSTYIITNVSTTNSKDRKGKYFFIRNKIQAQIIINKLWADSQGIINYLGEWHTHNEKSPKPSFVDKKLVKQMINNKNTEIKNAFMLILGKDKELYICTINSDKKIYQLKEE